MSNGAPGGGRRAVIVVCAVSLAVIVVAFLLRAQGSESTMTGRDPSSGASTEDAQRARLGGDARPSETPTGVPPEGLPGGLPTGATNGREGLGQGDLPPGLAGSGGGVSLPQVRIHLSVTSSEPIGVVGYQIPTSPNRSYGIVKNVGSSWSMSTVGYGRPDYARLFFRAGPSGAPVSCVITVNGRVTERRTTRGPYGAMMCQG